MMTNIYKCFFKECNIYLHLLFFFKGVLIDFAFQIYHGIVSLFGSFGFSFICTELLFESNISFAISNFYKKPIDWTLMAKGMFRTYKSFVHFYLTRNPYKTVMQNNVINIIHKVFQNYCELMKEVHEIIVRPWKLLFALIFNEQPLIIDGTMNI